MLVWKDTGEILCLLPRSSLSVRCDIMMLNSGVCSKDLTAIAFLDGSTEGEERFPSCSCCVYGILFSMHKNVERERE